MIYEYAVSPGLFANSKDVGFLLDSFGKGNGRLISKLPGKKWLELAFQEIRKSSCGQVEQKKLKNAANRLFRHASYARHGEQSVLQNGDWIELALTAHKQRPFKGILSEHGKSDHEAILINDLSLRENQRWLTPHSLTVKRDAIQMMDAVQPVLEASKTVILVDRNFQPDQERFVNVLLECIKRISSRKFGPDIRKISYILGDKKYECSYLQEKMERVRRQIPNSFVVEFIFQPWDDMHDRFMLTDIGGVEFGVGLDESLGGGTKTVRIKLMSDDDYRIEWKKANQANPACSITGTK